MLNFCYNNVVSLITAKTGFLSLIAIWYIISIPSYSISRMLPIVQMGERSWPLLFFLLDGLVLLATGLFLFFIIPSLWKVRPFRVRSFLWLFAGLLLIFPLITVMATYSDLTRELCKEHKNQKCVRYIPPPDLKNIRFTWEK